MFKQVILLMKKLRRKLGFGWDKEWNRCTICLRQVFFFAEDLAYKLNHHQITPKHFLLGLIYIEEDNKVLSTLKQLGIDLIYFRETLKRLIVYSMYSLKQIKKDIELTSRGRKVLELTFTKADELGDKFVDTTHLLYGILKEGGIASQVLNRLGVNEALLDEIFQYNKGMQG